MRPVDRRRSSTTGLTGCGGESAPAGDGTTTITFWDDNGGPARTPVWQHIIAEFQKANPKIKVQYVGIPIAQVQQKYDTAIAGGGLPDVGGRHDGDAGQPGRPEGARPGRPDRRCP